MSYYMFCIKNLNIEICKIQIVNSALDFSLLFDQ